jgi:hypothetical protein
MLLVIASTGIFYFRYNRSYPIATLNDQLAQREAILRAFEQESVIHDQKVASSSGLISQIPPYYVASVYHLAQPSPMKRILETNLNEEVQSSYQEDWVLMDKVVVIPKLFAHAST